MKRILSIFSLSLLTLSFILLQTTPAVNAAAQATAPSASTASSAETVDTLSYFTNTHGQTLAGSHAMSQTVNGQSIYNVNWSTDSYGMYTYDSNYIYLKEDHHGTPNPGSYTFADGRWMKRSMQVGEKIDVPTNQMQNFTVNTNSCTPTTAGNFPYSTTLLERLPSYDLGGTVGTQDVIVLLYDYRNGTNTDYEKMYYAKDWGMVKWELYHNDQLVQTSIFNEISTDAPTAPNLQTACIDTPVAPPIPTKLDGFVGSTLYGCILQNKQPNSQDVNLWLGKLKSEAVDIKGAYTQFYNTQNAQLSNEAFVKTVYHCILFREPDTAGYNNAVSGLANGAFTRSNLVQSVLGSQEFNAGILPKLRVLLPNSPALPTSLEGFVTTLYYCVHNIDTPDTEGYNFWLNHLKAKNLTIQGAYTEFFKYQTGFNNDQFTKKLFGCILFRPVDQASYNSVMKGLANGSLKRPQMVQYVLQSSEFKSGILPKLQALK